VNDSEFVYIRVRGSNSQETGLIDVVVEDTSVELMPNSSTALPVNDYPLYIGNYYLNQGDIGWLKFSPQESGDYSMLTTGSTDMYLTLYNSNLSVKASNDDGGQGTNAMISSVYLSKYSTYYIKIKGYSQYTYGSFNFYINRGLPISTYEQSDLFEYLNSSTYQNYNNCYTYALSMWQHPITGDNFRYNGQNPGEMSGDSITLSDLSDATTAYNAILTAIRADAAYYGGEVNPIGADEQPQEGFYKVALVLAPGQDYHWYRETINGSWVHKPSTLVARYFDASNEYIYNPETADRDGTASGIPNYTVFLGYFEVEVIDLASSTMMMQSLETTTFEESQVYEVNLNLSYDVVNRLDVGMEIDDVKSIIGEQHSTYGSGFIAFSYELIDGRHIIIYYTNNSISRIALLDNDVYTVIKE